MKATDNELNNAMNSKRSKRNENEKRMRKRNMKRLAFWHNANNNDNAYSKFTRKKKLHVFCAISDRWMDS